MASDLISDLVWRLGWALVHSLWQMALIGAGVSVALFVCARGSARHRYWIACFGLLSCYVPVLATFFLAEHQPATDPPAANSLPLVTESTVPTMRVDGSDAGRPVVASKAAVIGQDLAERQEDVAITEVSTAESRIRFVSADEEQVDVADHYDPVATLPASDLLGPWLPGVVSVWALAVALLSLTNAGGWVVAQRLRKQGAPVTDPSVILQFTQLIGRMRISVPVKLLQSTSIEMPMVIGWLRPVILLPTTLVTGLSVEQVNAVLAHELSHIRRRDYLVNLIQTMTTTLFFYHPIVWLLSRRIRLEREFCCDDDAITECGDRTEYVEALATVEQHRSAPQYAMAFAGRGGSLTLRRIRRILCGTDESSATSVGSAIMIAATMLPALAGFWHSSQTDASEQNHSSLGESDWGDTHGPVSNVVEFRIVTTDEQRAADAGIAANQEQAVIKHPAGVHAEHEKAATAAPKPFDPSRMNESKGLYIGFADDPGHGNYDGVIGSPGDVWNFIDVGTTAVDFTRTADAVPSTARLRVTRHDGEWAIKGLKGIFKSYIYHNCQCVDLKTTVTGLPTGRYGACVYAHGDRPDQNANIELVVGPESYGKKATLNDGTWDFRSTEFREGRQYVSFEFDVATGEDVSFISHRDGSGYSMFNAFQIVPLSSPVAVKTHSVASP